MHQPGGALGVAQVVEGVEAHVERVAPVARVVAHAPGEHRDALLPRLGLEGQRHAPEEVREREGRVEGRDLERGWVEPGVFPVGEHVPAEVATALTQSTSAARFEKPSVSALVWRPEGR